MQLSPSSKFSRRANLLESAHTPRGPERVPFLRLGVGVAVGCRLAAKGAQVFYERRFKNGDLRAGVAGVVAEKFQELAKSVFPGGVGASSLGGVLVVGMVLVEPGATDKCDDQGYGRYGKKRAKQLSDSDVCLDDGIDCRQEKEQAQDGCQNEEYLDEDLFCAGGGFAPRDDEIDDDGDGSERDDQRQ